ncbi:MAG TPA: DUF3857 domain-containing protein, partial [Oceanospirillales bacterium]|nr:DUF3857 domain-containing protein [Oceanospirillales bacterium]
MAIQRRIMKGKYMYKSILLALTLIYCINSNAQTAEAKASWVKQYPVTTASSETKGGTHNTFVNLYDQQIYFLDNKIHKYTHFANQVITAQGLEEVGKVEISFDPIYQKLHVHEVSILRGNKVINVLNNSKFEIIRKESELDQGIYNGVETAFILIKDLQLNDIVEYSYTIDGQNPIYDNRFFDVFTTQWTIPVGEFRLNLTVPKDLQLYF